MSTPSNQPKPKGDQARETEKPGEKPHANAAAWQKDIHNSPKDGFEKLTALQLAERGKPGQPGNAFADSVVLNSPFQRQDANRSGREQQPGDQQTNRPAERRRPGDKTKGPDMTDRLEARDGGDRDYKAAREKLIPELKKRLSPSEFDEYTRKGGHLDQMEKRMLGEHAKIEDNNKKVIGEVNQEPQLTERYNQLRELSQAAIRKDSEGNPLYNQADVTEAMRGFIKSAESPNTNNDQGANNTCALKASNKAAEAKLAGLNLKQTMQMVTQGQFEATDVDGSKFMCSVHNDSIKPDRQSREYAQNRGNSRNLAGQWFDLKNASYAQAIRGRQEAAEHGLDRNQGTNYYTYMDRQTAERGDTGERVLDNRTGQFMRSYKRDERTGEFTRSGNVAMSPEINAELLSNLKQAWIGSSISPRYGAMTTIGSREAYGDLPFMTTFDRPEQQTAHLQQLRNLDWGPATASTMVGNFMTDRNGNLSGAQGAHALAVELADNGKVNVYGSWGGFYEGQMSSAGFFNWMKVPPETPAGHPDGRRGDHVYVSDRPGRYDAGSIVRDKPVKDNEIDKPGDHKPGTNNDLREKDKLDRAKQEEEETKLTEARKKDPQKNPSSLSYVHSQIAAINNDLISNMGNPAETAKLLEQKSALLSLIKQGTLTT